MITSADIVPFAGTVGGGFFIGLAAGYAIKKLIRLAIIIIGLFIAALAFLEYKRILNVDWNRIEIVSQSGYAWITNAITHISNTIGSAHSGTFSHVGIPLVSSASAGLMLGLAKG
jgi:uncharacterized membrane protein (Fun14 family)